MFTLRCSRESTEAPLAADTYHLVKDSRRFDPDIGRFLEVHIDGINLPKEWSQPKSWNGLEIHSAHVPRGFLYLLTDAGRTRVLMLAGDT
jgi:hypothetical protein